LYLKKYRWIWGEREGGGGGGGGILSAFLIYLSQGKLTKILLLIELQISVFLREIYDIRRWA